MTVSQTFLRRGGTTLAIPSNSAKDASGKREGQNPGWFEAGINRLEPAIAAKRKSLLSDRREPSGRKHPALRKVRNDAQRIARHSANAFWLNLCQSIQLSADCVNIRAMYDGMRKAFGSVVAKIALLTSATGDVITDTGNRWRDGQSTITISSLERILSAMQKLRTLTLYYPWKNLRLHRPLMNQERHRFPVQRQGFCQR